MRRSRQRGGERAAAAAARDELDEDAAAREDAAAHEDMLRRREAAAHFDRVAASLERILAPTPTLDMEPGLTAQEERGLELLFSATRGQENGQRLSGLVRLKMLERALALLRPGLVAAYEARSPERHKLYDALSAKIDELRERISERAWVEGVAFDGGGDDGGAAAEADGEEEGRREGEGGGAAAAVSGSRAIASLEILTDELARGDSLKETTALVDLLRAFRSLSSATPEAREPAVRALESALRRVLADPADAVEGLSIDDPDAALAAISEARDLEGEAPEGDAAETAALRVLEALAGSGGGDQT